MITEMRGFLIVLTLLLILGVVLYNGFISRRNAMRNAFASIDVQLRKRWHLIPNLVETVKGFAKHEKEVLESVIAARNAAPGSRDRFAKEGEVMAGVGRLLAVAESFPDLKSNEQFLFLQRNLTEVESQISASQRAYNAAVTDWNVGVEAFPGVLFAKVFNFERADWFEVRASERKNVEVSR
ncbi:MAG: LemA protein [Akkermansiaceae bacterium]|jgi:LemA protein